MRIAYRSGPSVSGKMTVALNCGRIRMTDQGRVIAGHRVGRDWRAMPAAIFTEPEIATVGMSERECAAAGRKVLKAFPATPAGFVHSQQTL